MPHQDNQKPLDTSNVLMEHIPDNLLIEPIEYIFADHCRQRDMCKVLQSLAKQKTSAEAAVQSAELVLECLTHDLPLHIADEEKDLFPYLKKRAKPKDNVDNLLRLLSMEHERDHQLVTAVVAGLEKMPRGLSAEETSDFNTAAEVLAASHLSHLDWENAVVLDLARRRLTDDDQKAMAISMAARRSIELPKSN